MTSTAFNVLVRETDALGRPAVIALSNSPYAVTYGHNAFGRFQSATSAQSAETFTYSYLPGSDLLASMTNTNILRASARGYTLFQPGRQHDRHGRWLAVCLERRESDDSGVQLATYRDLCL